MQTQNTSFNTQKTTTVMLLQMPLISTFIGPLYCKGYTLQKQAFSLQDIKRNKSPALQLAFLYRTKQGVAAWVEASLASVGLFQQGR